MMTKFRNKAVAFLAALMVISAHAATAATCSAIQLVGDVSGFSVGADSQRQCAVGSVNNDKVGGGELQVNADKIFGSPGSPWSLLTKLSPKSGNANDAADHPDGGLYSDHISLVSGSDGQFGTFRIDESARDAFNDIMIIMKGPKSFDYVAFLVEDLVGLSELGDYRSVFYKDAKGKKSSGGSYQDISHFSVYGRSATAGVVVAPVPVPAALPLMAGALGLLVLLRRRRGGVR